MGKVQETEALAAVRPFMQELPERAILQQQRRVRVTTVATI
jgi:hypothetical protein